MSTIRSLTATLALALAIPFAGAHAAEDCAEAVSIKSASKDAKTVPAADSKNLAGKHIANLPSDAAIATKPPVQAKMGKPQAAIPPLGEKSAWSKAFQKQKGHCC